MRPNRQVYLGQPPVSGYRAWYDAADVSTLTISSNTVTAWADKTGSYNATGAGTTKPGYGGSTSIKINGITVPYFGGSTNNTYFTTSLDASTRTRTVFAVVRMTRTSTTSGQALIGSHLNAGLEWQIGGPGGYMNATSNQTVALTTGKSMRHLISAPQVLVIRLSSTVVDFYRNELKSVSHSNSTTFTASRTTWIGATYVGGNGGEVLNGGIGELIDYGSTLTDAQVASVVKYLMTKWGIS